MCPVTWKHIHTDLSPCPVIVPVGSSDEASQSLEMAVDKIRSINRSALFTVLRQEIDRFNHLLSVIHQSLKSLQLAIKGEVVMSEKLDEAYNAILKQQVPAHWRVRLHIGFIFIPF